jgi:CheY-like chemotaxis protein
MSAPVKRILIVDDDVVERFVLRGAFEARGYWVDECGNAEDALDICKSDRPSLVVADLNLPGASGHDLTRSLRARFPTSDVPIVIITGTRNADGWDRAIDAGAQAMVLKTSDLTPVIQTVDRLLGEADSGNVATIRMRPPRRRLSQVVNR